MKIVHAKEAVQVAKPEGTNVTYFLFPEYEVHFNEQIPNSTQTWHRHEKIWETLYIIEGELTAKWKEAGRELSEVVKEGDVIESERNTHTFTNHTNKVVKFLVIKQVLSGEDKKEILKFDKVIER